MFFPQDSLEHCNYVRHHGVLQFIATFRRLRHLENDRLFYGDEIEYSLLKVELPTFFFLPLSLAVIVQRPCRTEGPVAWADDVPDFTMQDSSRFIGKDPPFARCSSPHFAVSCLAATVRRQSPACKLSPQVEKSGKKLLLAWRFLSVGFCHQTNPGMIRFPNVNTRKKYRQAIIGFKLV